MTTTRKEGRLGTTTNQTPFLPVCHRLFSIVFAQFNFAAVPKRCLLSAFVYNRIRWRLIFFGWETDYGEASTQEMALGDNGNGAWGQPQTERHFSQFDTVYFRSFLPSLTLWVSPSALLDAAQQRTRTR